MKDKMLKFVDIDQETPNKRMVDNRIEDFRDIYNEFINVGKQTVQLEKFLPLTYNNEDDSLIEEETAMLIENSLASNQIKSVIINQGKTKNYRCVKNN